MSNFIVDLPSVANSALDKQRFEPPANQRAWTHADADRPAAIEWRRSLAPVPYRAALAEQEARNAAIAAGDARELVWLLEHPPVYTAGTSAAAAELLDPRFEVVETGRGGRYTYHGPGQRVGYVLLDLARRGRDVRRFVHALEGWVIATLARLRRRGVGGARADRHLDPRHRRRARPRSARSGCACASG